MTLFDAYVMVDWSSLGKPAPASDSPNAIWIAGAGAARMEPEYCRTRRCAEAFLTRTLLTLRGDRRRVLVGFDFPFGYPAGFAKAVTGRPGALDLWADLAARVTDAPNNANDRFHVAGRLNAALPGTGPFWGNGLKADVPGLPRTRNRAYPDLPDRRIVERHVRSAKTCWQISGAGSVGGQVLTGLPMLHRMRTRPDLGPAIRVWPFETGLAPPDAPPDAPIVLAEIYPSLWAREIAAARDPDEILDRAQVRVTASVFETLDASGDLAALFAGPASLTASERATIVAEEGWILGARAA